MSFDDSSDNSSTRSQRNVDHIKENGLAAEDYLALEVPGPESAAFSLYASESDSRGADIDDNLPAPEDTLALEIAKPESTASWMDEESENDSRGVVDIGSGLAAEVHLALDVPKAESVASSMGEESVKNLRGGEDVSSELVAEDCLVLEVPKLESAASSLNGLESDSREADVDENGLADEDHLALKVPKSESAASSMDEESENEFQGEEDIESGQAAEDHVALNVPKPESVASSLDEPENIPRGEVIDGSGDDTDEDRLALEIPKPESAASSLDESGNDSREQDIETRFTSQESYYPEDEKTSRIHPSEDKAKKCRCWTGSDKLVCLLILAILVIVLVSFQLGKENSDEKEGDDDNNIFSRGDGIEWNSTLVPESPMNPSRLETLREMVTPDSGVNTLTDPNTPQYAALLWMANEDPAFLDLETTSIQTISDRYRAALVYFASGGKGWRVQHGFLTETSICEWNDAGVGGAFEGIRCEDNQVVEIILDMNLLEGTIPTEIALLNLQALGLGSNSMKGTIPTELGVMEDLTWLSLSGNFLSGTLPSELGNLYNLQDLLLYNNQLEGTIPASFQGLVDLNMIFMQGNAFTGNIDAILCDRSTPFKYFYADCAGSAPNILCSCCTHCCRADGRGCTQTSTV